MTQRDPFTNRVIRDPLSMEDKVDTAMDAARELNFDYSATFSLPAGKSVLADLESQFGGSPLVPGDPFMSHAKAGAQEVMIYIRDRMRIPDNGS